MARTEKAVDFRWYHSLIFRIGLLCAVLVLCLFAAVYVIIHHYTEEIVVEMSNQARQMARSVTVELEKAEVIPNLEELERRLEADTGMDVELDKGVASVTPLHVTLERDGHGITHRVARTVIQTPQTAILMTIRVPLNTSREVARVLQNRQMLAVTLLFLVTLAVMIYVIVRLLQPLKRLSRVCRRISAGDFDDVPLRGAAGEVRALETTFNQMVASLREKEVVEANLRQAQRLSALGTLAAGVAHDVRNPLNAIKLLSSHALDASGDGKAAKYLETIREEVDRLDGIVSSFLSLAKQREIEPEPCEVDRLLEECVQLIRKDAENRNVTLQTELRLGGAMLKLDPKQFKRAVVNVLLNALEACSGGGRVRLFSRQTDQACEIEVRDDGPGLSEEEAERAFDPYYTTKPTGTGLGLSLTRGIIEEHGGTISLSCTPGQGCQVLITLPAKAKVS